MFEQSDLNCGLWTLLNAAVTILYCIEHGGLNDVKLTPYTPRYALLGMRVLAKFALLRDISSAANAFDTVINVAYGSRWMALRAEAAGLPTG